MERNKRLGEEKIGKLLWSFSLPAISAMLLNALYGVVDRIFVGRGVGSLAIAGVMVGLPIMLLIMACGMLIGIGGSAALSIFLGQNKKEDAENTIGNAVTLSLIFSFLITSLGLIFLHPLLRSFGASNETIPYAEKFVRIILSGSLFGFLSFGMSNIIRAEGNPMFSMVTQMTGAVLNAVFCYVFIFIFKWGIEGSAAATVLAQFITSVMVMGYFYTKKSIIHVHWKNLRLKADIVKRILSIGLSPFSIQAALGIMMAIFNFQLGKYGGDIAISAWGAINSIMLFILMPIFGLNQGSQPIIGFNFGAKNCPRIRETLKLTIFVSTIIVFTGFIIIQIFARPIISAFSTNDAHLVDVGSTGLRIFLAMLPVVGFQISGSNYFQSIGKPLYSIMLTLSRQILLLIPLVLILPHFLGLFGIWLAGPVSDFLSFLLTLTFILRELKKLKTLERCV